MTENNQREQEAAKYYIKIKADGRMFRAPVGSSLLHVLELMPPRNPKPLSAVINGQMQPLTYTVFVDSEVVWLDHSNSGTRLYKRALIFIMLMAKRKLFPQYELRVLYSLDNGSYCTLKGPGELLAEDIAALQDEMQRIIAADLPISDNIISKEDAIKFFSDNGAHEKATLLAMRDSSTLHLYSCGETSEYFFGHMPPSTGLLNEFYLISFDEGFVLMLPAEKGMGFSHDEFKEPRRMQAILKERKRWNEKLNTSTITQLNRHIDEGRLNEMVLVNEAFHSRELAKIADSIFADFPRVRIVLVAGPSSSGKTTFTQRLAIQFLTLGIRPITISLDDYFFNREDTPTDEFGEKDFESINAVDVDLFGVHLKALLNGDEVFIPRYDFVTGTRMTEGIPCRLQKDQILIIEGIHGLNDVLVKAIPEESRRRIYISALTQLNMDDYTPIQSSDNRLIRRIARDMQFRNCTAEETITRWQSVRRGEFVNIFPYQEQADYFFNSSLTYELPVLRSLVEKALSEIRIDSPAYLEARRLRRFVQYFVPAETHCIPLDSILQEFLGKSCFYK